MERRYASCQHPFLLTSHTVKVIKYKPIWVDKGNTFTYDRVASHKRGPMIKKVIMIGLTIVLLVVIVVLFSFFKKNDYTYDQQFCSPFYHGQKNVKEPWKAMGKICFTLHSSNYPDIFIGENIHAQVQIDINVPLCSSTNSSSVSPNISIGLFIPIRARPKRHNRSHRSIFLKSSDTTTRSMSLSSFALPKA